MLAPGYTVVFCDESMIRMRNRKNRFWSPVGERAKEPLSKTPCNVTVIAAMT